MKRNLVILALLVVILVVVGGWALRHLLGTMIYPVPGKITSPYGNRVHPVDNVVRFHNGIDLSAASGTSVKAIASGVVTKRYTDDLGGNSVVIKHDNGFTSGYAHLSSFLVSIGDRVKQGQVIAKSGATGKVTGPHLHLTMRGPSGAYVNPVDYLT